MKILKVFLVLISLCLYLNADDDYEEHYEKFEKYKDRYYKSSKHHLYKSLDYLDLNDFQIKQLKGVLIEYKKSYKRFYRFKNQKELELSELIKQNEFNTKKYKEIKEQIKAYALDLEIENLKNIHRILNTKQREDFSYFLKEWKVE